jgi:hypothetical protein
MTYFVAALWVASGLYAYPDFCRWQRRNFPENEHVLTSYRRDTQLLLLMLIGPLAFLVAFLSPKKDEKE